jgi:hypothetical protein
VSSSLSQYLYRLCEQPLGRLCTLSHSVFVSHQSCMAELDIAPQFGAELKVGRLPIRWIMFK